LAASFFNLVPQSMKDFVSYLQKNTLAFLFTLCFLVACYVVLRIKTQRKWTKYGE
jgi:hypothetical protein